MTNQAEAVTIELKKYRMQSKIKAELANELQVEDRSKMLVSEKIKILQVKNLFDKDATGSNSLPMPFGLHQTLLDCPLKSLLYYAQE